MTVQEAIEKLIYMPVEIFDNKAFEAKEMGIKALEQLEQYRALGTMEELKEAREKQIQKKANAEGEFFKFQHCPSCETLISYGQKFCHGCGQALKWEEGGTSD